MAKKKQLSKASDTPVLRFMNHGGKRKGAGRKAKRHADGSRVEPSHQKRPHFTKSRPLHVTVEVAEDVPNFRAANIAPVVSDAIGRANRRADFRVVHFCLAGTHMHLICEADGPEELAFEGAPLSFAEPMPSATGALRHRSGARNDPKEVERGQELGTAPNRPARPRRERRAAAT